MSLSDSDWDYPWPDRRGEPSPFWTVVALVLALLLILSVLV